MKKFITLAVLAGVAVFGAGCEASSSASTGNSGTTVTTSAVNTVSEKTSGLSKSQCDSMKSEYNSLMSQASTALDGIDASNSVEVAAAVEMGRQAVSTGRTITGACAKYDPAGAARFDASLDSLEHTLNGM